MTVQSATPSLGAAYALKCRECGALTELDASYACFECFGPLEVAYAPATLTRAQIEAGPPSMSNRLALRTLLQAVTEVSLSWSEIA